MILPFEAGVYAADPVPGVSITMNRTKTSASIKLQDVGIMIYSAQITFNIDSRSTDYSLTTADRSMYGTVKKDDQGNTVLYIDSTELMDGSEEISLATLVSDKEMNFGELCELVLVDRSMKSLTYSGIDVKTSIISSSRPTGGISSPNKYVSADNKTDENKQDSVNESQNKPTAFTDIENHWAKESIMYVTEKGLFNGMSDTEFEPNTQMNRAMYVTVLNRFGDKIDKKWKIECDSPMKFDDVADGEWYSEAVAWAGGTGIVNGIGGNMFGPRNSITREQIAVMTVNFAKLCGVELPADNERAEFADEDEIHDWAVDAVYAAQQAGLIYGRDNGDFSPLDTATRAEVAAILHRFSEKLK